MPRGVVAAVAVVVLLAGCTAGPMPTPTPTLPTPSGDGVLRIGTLFSTSGDGAATAAGLTAAVNAAVREIDAAGGVGGAPVEVVSRNAGTAGDGTAEASFADLVERGVDVVIGPTTVEVAALVVPLAAQAGIPVITPAATGGFAEGTLFRTVPTTFAQGSRLGALVGAEAKRVALLRSGDDDLSAGLVDGLPDGAELVADVAIGADPAADVAQLVAATPDAVVLSAADAGPETAALITSLTAAGLGGDKLWITGPAITRFDGAIGPLEGAHGIQSGAVTDSEFAARIRQEDPGARSLLYAADAYDATVLVALAAVLAADDGGRSVEATLRTAAADGIPCRSFGECVDVLTTLDDVAYEGVSGPLVFAENGERRSALYVRYLYGADNVPAVVDSVDG